jgi:hypothetical protein
MAQGQHGGPSFPTVPDSKRALAPPSKSENARFLTEGMKVITSYSAGGIRSPVPPFTQKPNALNCTSLQDNLISPVQELES